MRLLDDYRRSFGEAYEVVVRAVREQLLLEPTGRPAKSTSSLIEKLHRESIRRSQVQDIAGCRVVVADAAQQKLVVASLRTVFPGSSVIDRRANPSYGYRAVHVIAQISGKLIEIQVRSSLQHLWAELSEKLSDEVDPAIKYGGGPDVFRQVLTEASELVMKHEQLEQRLDVPGKHLQEFREQLVSMKNEIARFFSQAISRLASQKGQKQ